MSYNLSHNLRGDLNKSYTVLASPAALCSTLPGPPGAPSAPAALNVGSSEIELGWRPPVQDGGPYISGFRLKVLIHVLLHWLHWRY